MKITYENEWRHTDIHIDMSFPYEEDYQFHMMKHNRIRHLLQGKGMRNERREPVHLLSGMRYVQHGKKVPDKRDGER